jgi:hypothetical protein
LADLLHVGRTTPGERERVSALDVHVGLKTLPELKLTLSDLTGKLNNLRMSFSQLVFIEIDVTSTSLMKSLNQRLSARAALNYRPWTGIYHSVNTEGQRIRVIMLN